MLHLLFTEAQKAPTLTVNNNNPTEGDTITLTCDSVSQNVDKYHFIKDGTVKNVSTQGTYVIKSVLPGTTVSGDYRCQVFKNNFSSPDSNVTHVVG